MYNVNVNIDGAAILHLIGTALLHAYRSVNLSVPATLIATEDDIADAFSIMGKCEGNQCSPPQEELDELNHDLLMIRQEEKALESAAPWSFRAMKKAFSLRARAKRLKFHATMMAKMAKNARFPRLLRRVTRTLTRTATKTANALGLHSSPTDTPSQIPPASSRSSESTLRNPSESPAALTNLLSSQTAAPPCSCSCTSLLSHLDGTSQAALISVLSQGIVDAQTKAPNGNETHFHPNEAALAQLVADLIKFQAAETLGSTLKSPDAALIQSLAMLLTPTPAPTPLAAGPVTVAR
ncbi:hypothetical protein DFH06DRAFT_1164645 [Mycena polygramma]|nr:hypothetical protein DFH06DRAFT_1164645 [Mycena polygramma]